MSSFSKATTVIIVLVLIGLGIWWYSTSSSAPLTQTTPSADTAAAQTALPAAPDTSDASLQNDLNAADTGISAVSSDSAQVDGGLNDKPVSQQ